MAGSVNKPCQKCGKAYSRPKKCSDGQWAGRKFCSKRCAAKRISVPDVEIVSIYNRGSSSTEIAKLFGISGAHVLRILKASGVTIRSASEGMKISHSRPSTLAKLSASSSGRVHTEATKDKLRKLVGPLNANWRNGMTISAQGYLVFTASEENGAHAGKALHTEIAEWKIGRPLMDGEVVHHKDRNKLNNDPSNLQVMTASDHAKLHFLAGEFTRKKHA